jgi:hypothetical protein
MYRSFRLVLGALSTALLGGTGLAWQQPVLENPICLESGSFGSVFVEVEADACREAPAPCDGFKAEPANGGNANPLRLVVLVATPRPLEDLTVDSFDIVTSFAPEEAAPVAPFDCPACFEHGGGGAYSVWLAPSEEDWREGTYYLRLGIAGEAAIVPALVKLEIPPGASNAPPLAGLVAVPPSRAQVDEEVIFDGSLSLDPDGDPLTCFQWTIDSSDPAFDETIQGVAASALSRVYPVEQSLVVTLRVSDDPALANECTDSLPPVDPARLSPNIAVVQYEIECANPRPVAAAGPDITASIDTVVRLDGRGSFDPDGPIDRYRWACGNGSIPIPSGDPAVVFCRYTALGAYTAELTVSDRGTGVIDPNTGTWECVKSDTDTTTVTIVAPADETGSGPARAPGSGAARELDGR